MADFIDPCPDCDLGMTPLRAFREGTEVLAQYRCVACGWGWPKLWSHPGPLPSWLPEADRRGSQPIGEIVTELMARLAEPHDTKEETDR